MSAHQTFSPYHSDFSQQMMKLIKSDFKKSQQQSRYPTPNAPRLLPQILNNNQRASLNYSHDYEFPKIDIDKGDRNLKLQKFIEAREQATLYQTRLRLQNKKKKKQIEKQNKSEEKKKSTPLNATMQMNDMTTNTDKQSQNRSLDVRITILNSQQEKPRNERFTKIMVINQIKNNWKQSNMNREFHEIKQMMKNLQKTRKKNDQKLFNRIKGKATTKTSIEQKQVHFTQ